MKKLTAISALLATALPVALSAAIPLDWDVEVTKSEPAVFYEWQGGDYDFNAFLKRNGKPFAIDLQDGVEPRLYWQTNGMDHLYWSVPASVAQIQTTFGPQTVFHGKWLPEMETGNQAYNCFIGITGMVYNAAFKFCLRKSPGAHPNDLPLPVKTLDFAQVAVLNAPYYSKSETDAALADKQDTISDLASIRSGAALGATAVQPSAISDMETKTHAAATYQPKGSYLTSESDPTVPSWAKATTKPSYTAGEVGVSMGVGAQSVAIAVSPAAATMPTFDFFCQMMTYKQDTISDLATIRSGAALGATAVQPAAITDMETQTHAAATYQPKGSYLTSESDPTVDNKLAPIETIVSAWQTYWDGDDVRVTVTNYYGSQDLPSLYIEQKISDGGTNYYKTIWTEKARLNVIFDRLLQLESDVATKADRAWGYYDSHAGTYAPDGFTSISSGSILVSKDMSYQKTVTSAGEVWVLTATDPTVITGAETNGFFRISDSEGNSIFEVVKGDKRIAPATVSSVTAGGNSLTINFNVESAAHPSLEICSDLVDADWKAEDEASCPATVVWSGTSGSYVATVTGKAAMPKMFVKGTYEVGGETYARHGVPLGFDRVVIGGVFYRVAVETVSGKKLMTLTEL